MSSSGYIVATLLGLALAGAGCKKDACDSDGLDRVIAATASVSDAERSELVAQGLLEFCASPDTPMPLALRESLSAVREWAPGPAAAKIIEALKADSELWNRVCQGGQVAFSREVLRDDRQSLAVGRACAADRLGFASEAEFASARLSSTYVSLAAFSWLGETGTTKVRAHRLARGLLGYE